ncbi:MAG TPA: division/cell wall cluster transcriptional repressor MraZ [Treponema sp.]|jgi:MraZ protein|nr:division/cell wall cluster transcriptional repressor MraZ [Treponema sp.]HON12527.1 division/cell wall cluster transcriptional repressor MraZ [Treponema sp.]HPC71075.1 division/cell wall cluster transcriptional repressor MraZ [Treponema sp.]HRS02942.1 division/cell wall cluster transcriptional repressor MraZ [Treponema sp.]HRU27514.1 division/cell wall cluster transcriptional repressor MraZ [Treponema sp.]
MDLLTGEFKNTLDEKGRLSLPVRLRSELPGNILVMTQGVDRCLWLFAPEQWKILSRKLMETTSPFQARARMVQRRIIAPAQEVEIDKAGRIAIPQSLREFAALNRECVILGIDKYIEIWDSDQYKQYWNENEAEFRSAAEELGSVFL